jgi:hypothetical protein
MPPRTKAIHSKRKTEWTLRNFEAKGIRSSSGKSSGPVTSTKAVMNASVEKTC